MAMIICGLLWFAAISVGLMAGVYFTFSTFVMRALDDIESPSGMLAMQSINRVIQRSLFLPLFFASTLACIVLGIVAAMDLSGPGAIAMLAGSALYVVGMFIVTLIANVPLNNALEATDARSADGEAMWRRYMQRWTVWNHVRTLSCTAACALLICALLQTA